MLKFYYAALSPFARPVWLMLLEKGLEFELIPMQLNGDQFEPNFIALN
ncbi:MAG: glutathione S-transferase N-terminal domain-containing protein, partial [Cyanobacteria bacterium J06641_5]